jgi:hypothetical protein
MSTTERRGKSSDLAGDVESVLICGTPFCEFSAEEATDDCNLVNGPSAGFQM